MIKDQKVREDAQNFLFWSDHSFFRPPPSSLVVILFSETQYSPFVDQDLSSSEYGYITHMKIRELFIENSRISIFFDSLGKLEVKMLWIRIKETIFPSLLDPRIYISRDISKSRYFRMLKSCKDYTLYLYWTQNMLRTRDLMQVFLFTISKDNIKNRYLMDRQYIYIQNIHTQIYKKVDTPGC